MTFSLKSNIIPLLLVLLVSCASIPDQEVEYESHQVIPVADGPEDMVLDTFGSYDRLLVICNERREGITQGAIWEYDFKEDFNRALKVVFKDSTHVFHPIGGDILSVNGEHFLFATNHPEKKKSEIIRFKIFEDSLVEDHIFTDIIGHPNDVLAVSTNEFIYSHDGKLGGKLVKHKNGNEILAKRKWMANGVMALGEEVYFSTTFSHKLFRLELKPNGKWRARKVVKVRGADNITAYQNQLIVTSHINFRKFAKHVKSSEVWSPSVVYQINPVSGDKKVLLSDVGGLISCSSTGIIYKEDLYLVQVFDGFILRSKLKK